MDTILCSPCLINDIKNDMFYSMIKFCCITIDQEQKPNQTKIHAHTHTLVIFLCMHYPFYFVNNTTCTLYIAHFTVLFSDFFIFPLSLFFPFSLSLQSSSLNIDRSFPLSIISSFLSIAAHISRARGRERESERNPDTHISIGNMQKSFVSSINAIMISTSWLILTNPFQTHSLRLPLIFYIAFTVSFSTQINIFSG